MRNRNRAVGGLIALCVMALAIAAACGGWGEGAEDEAPIEVIEPTAQVTMDQGAVYMTLKNHSDGADWLVSVKSMDASEAELHEVIVEGAASSMRPVSKMELPAGGTLVLEKGGRHIMLVGLRAGIEEGDYLHMDLHFEKAGLVHTHPLVTLLRASPADMDGAHEGMDHAAGENQ